MDLGNPISWGEFKEVSFSDSAVIPFSTHFVFRKLFTFLQRKSRNGRELFCCLSIANSA